MNLSTDQLFERRKLKQKLTIWRVMSILLGAILIITIIYYSASEFGISNKTNKDHIAILPIEGFIGLNQKQIDILNEIEENDNAKALIIKIDSPGGTVAGAEVLYNNIRAVAEKKPVVAVMGSIAASGGYVVALATDKIYAHQNTLTGSIGVLFQWAELSKMLENVGVTVYEEKSSKLKAAPSLFSPPDEEALAITKELIADTHNWFLGLVSERRKMTMERARKYGDGRVYNGRQAIKINLIDEIGDLRKATKWIKHKKNLDDDIEIIDWSKIDDGEKDIYDYLSRAVTSSIIGTVGELSSGFIKRINNDSIKNTGLMAVWKPEK